VRGHDQPARALGEPAEPLRRHRELHGELDRRTRRRALAAALPHGERAARGAAAQRRSAERRAGSARCSRLPAPTCSLRSLLSVPRPPLCPHGAR
jgi:hypothetical protein